MIPASEAPTGGSRVIDILEDETYDFNSTDFGFSDVDGDALESVRIVDFTGSGTLTLDGAPVADDDVIWLDDIPNLQYQPGANENGNALATVTFRVSDDGDSNNEDTVDRTLTFDVQRQDDRPTGMSQSLTAIEDQPFTYSAADFGFESVDGSGFASVRIVNFLGSGSLLFDGNAVSPGDVIDVDDLSRLTYQAGQDDFGPALSQIEFRVIDSSVHRNEDDTTRTLTMNVTPTSDAPVGVSDTVDVDEDDVLKFTDATFGFSDPVDADDNSFAGVEIIGFSGNGTLTLDGSPVANNDIVLATDLPNLEYRPASNSHGDALDTIEFRVIDSGSADNLSLIHI